MAPQLAEPTAPTTTVDMNDDDALLQRAADATRLLLAHAPLQSMKDLVHLWLSSGANLALGGALLGNTIDSIDLALTSMSTNANWHRRYAELLLRNSAQTLHSNSSLTLAEFCAQFTEHNIRWETLGLFALAVIRASYDVPYFAPLYSKDNGIYDLRKRCFRVANCALEIALSLDQLNDLQLVLQYENLIVHSYIAGDQSQCSSPSGLCQFLCTDETQAISIGDDLGMELRQSLLSGIIRPTVWSGMPLFFSKSCVALHSRESSPPIRIWPFSSVDLRGCHAISATFRSHRLLRVPATGLCLQTQVKSLPIGAQQLSPPMWLSHGGRRCVQA